MSGLSAYTCGNLHNQQPVIRCLALMGEVQPCKQHSGNILHTMQLTPVQVFPYKHYARASPLGVKPNYCTIIPSHCF